MYLEWGKSLGSSHILAAVFGEQIWWSISGSTIYDDIVLAASFILPSYWPSDSRKWSFLNRVWEGIGAPRTYFFIPTSFLLVYCFWAILDGFAVSWPSVWTGQAIIIQGQVGKRKGHGNNFSQKVLASGALLHLFLCWQYPPPREPAICISVNVSTRLCMHVSHSVVSNCCDPMDCSLPASCPWDSPGKNTEVGCHFLLKDFVFSSDLKNINLPFTAVHSQVDSQIQK